MSAGLFDRSGFPIARQNTVGITTPEERMAQLSAGMAGSKDYMGSLQSTLGMFGPTSTIPNGFDPANYALVSQNIADLTSGAQGWQDSSQQSLAQQNAAEAANQPIQQSAYVGMFGGGSPGGILPTSAGSTANTGTSGNTASAPVTNLGMGTMAGAPASVTTGPGSISGFGLGAAPQWNGSGWQGGMGSSGGSNGGGWGAPFTYKNPWSFGG